jgi:ribonuclease HI
VPSPTRPLFQVYTDGGADPNPGPGGWGAVILDDSGAPVRELSGGEDPSTNNRMELTAALKALEALPQGAPVALYTDSTYLKKGITQWLPGWIARGWRRKTGKLQNEDLWRGLAAAVAGRQISWHWVKGHAGHEHNERADELATAAIRGGSGKARARSAQAVEAADAEVYLRVSSNRSGGGWAAVVREGANPPDGEGELRTGSVRRASANELDVLAAAEVLEGLPEGLTVALHTGSDYLRNGATQWIEGWRQRGWTTKAGTPVKNREAWERLAAALDRRKVLWPSIKGALPEGWKELGAMARGAAGE